MASRLGNCHRRRRIATFLVTACLAVAGFAVACAPSPSAVDWTIPVPVADEGGYTVQLSDQQRSAALSATYSVIMRNNWGCYAVVEGAPAELGESGEVRVPADPLVVAAVVDGGKDNMLCASSCAQSDDGSLVYSVDNLRLCASVNLGPSGLLLGADTVSATVSIAPGADEPAVSMTRKAASYPLGAAVTDNQLSLYRGVQFPWGGGRSKTRNADGSFAPIGAWEKTDSVSGSYYMYEHGMSMALVPLSTFKGDYFVQVVVEDASGALHGSDIAPVSEPDREEPHIVTLETERGSMSFVLVDGKAVLQSYSGEDERVEVPAEAEGAPVVEVGAEAFAGNEYVHEVVLPDSIASIGAEAFRDSRLQHFAIPAHLQHLGSAAFARAKALASFSQDGDNGITSVRDGVLYSADGSTLLAYPSAMGDAFDVPEGVSAIGYAAFCGADVARVGFPDTLKAISPCAFAGCTSLAAVDLPDGLQSIGAAAFAASPPVLAPSDSWYAPVSTLRIGPDVSYVGTDAFAGLALTSIEVDGKNTQYKGVDGFLTSADGVLLQAPSALVGAIEVPEGITGLAAGSLDDFGQFSPTGKSGVVDIFLPSSLQSIEDGALPTIIEADDADTLDAVPAGAALHVPEGSWAEGYALEHNLAYDYAADADALRYREQAVSVRKGQLSFRVYADHAELFAIAVEDAGHVRIPDQVDGVPVTAIGIDGNDQASGIVKTIIVPAGVERIRGSLLSRVQGVRKFEVDEGNEHFTVREGSIYTVDGTMLVAYPCDRGETYEVPEGTVEIGPGAFHGATATTIQLPEGLEVIGKSAFRGCSKLQQIGFPSTLREVGASAFESSGLTSVHLNDGLQSIGDKAFMGLASYDGLRVPDSVTTIGADAFSRAYSSDGPASIGSSTLGVGSGLEQLGSGAFAGLDVQGFAVASGNGHFSADGPFLLSKDGRELFACGAAAGGKVHVPDGVEAIGNHVFDEVPSVTDVYLPDSVLRISSVVTDGSRSKTGENPITFHCASGSEAAMLLEKDGLNWVEG